MKTLRNVCIGILVVLLILMYGGSALTRMAFSKPVDVYNDPLDDAGRLKRGFAIETDLPLLGECFGTATSTQTNGYDNSTLVGDATYYFIMPVPVGEETYYVALETSQKQDSFDMLRKLSQSNRSGAEPVHITGGLTTLDDELYQYMKIWFKDSELFENEADIEKYVLPLSFSEENYLSLKIIFFVQLAIAVALLTAIIVISRKEKKAAESGAS